MTNSDTTPEERPAETLGSRFRSARTSQGKSLQEVAQVTRINPTILAALESDNFAKMPAEVFTRGFIKLYAQYLGLDANETIKLYSNQENLDPERPTEEPYSRDVLNGAAMARPLSLFRANPRLRIIAILLTALLSFYVLGAILKAVQKRPDQAAPENELAKSLMDSNTPPLPGPPGELPAATEIPGTTPLPTIPSETQPGAGPAADAQESPGAGVAPSANQPFQSTTAGTVPAGQPARTPTPETAGPGDLPQPRPTANTPVRR